MFMTFLRYILFSSIILALSLNAKSKYPVGEKLEFQAYALGFVPIGKVWMNVDSGSLNNVPTYRFRVRCYGDYKVYLADVRVSSDISKENDHSLVHSIEQFGSQRRGRKLIFNWNNNTADYFRRETNGQYRLCKITKITPDVWDVLGCAFRERRLFNTKLGSSTDIKCIETTKVYDLRCTVVER